MRGETQFLVGRPKSRGRLGPAASGRHKEQDFAAIARPRNENAPDRSPRYAFGAWEEIAHRSMTAEHLAIFLDFDGTLVNFRRRPEDVRTPLAVKRILKRLIQHKSVSVSIVSGRRVRDLRGRLGVRGLGHVGLHGGEMNGGACTVGPPAKRALSAARRLAVEQLGALPGIRVEDKEHTFAVHFRGAAPAVVNRGSKALRAILETSGNALHMLCGSKVWEVLPREIPGKARAVKRLLARHPLRTTSIYIGDDGTDEAAFVFLDDQITIRSSAARGTHARYYLRGPADVVRFLTRLERILS